MAQITINEISNNFTYAVANNQFATVALPITSCWGPGFFDPESMYSDEEAPTFEEKMALELEDVVWERFSANQAGMESFVSTYRGAASNYRLAKDYSYQMALTLLSNGYDVLTCRLCPGDVAQSPVMVAVGKNGEVVEIPSEPTIEDAIKEEENKTEDGTVDETGDGSETPETGDGSDTPADETPAEEPTETPSEPVVVTKDSATLALVAKYPGSFGNQLMCSLKKARNKNYWNLVVYIIDSSGVRTAVENNAFVFDPDNSTDAIPHVDEIESNFVKIVTTGIIEDTDTFVFMESGESINDGITLSGGTDRAVEDENLEGSDLIASMLKDAATYALQRFTANKLHSSDEPATYDYIKQLEEDGGLVLNGNKFETKNAPIVEDKTFASTIKYREWIFRFAPEIYALLKDKLAYNPNRIISPGWDDIDITSIGGQYVSNDALQVIDYASPIHIALMSVAYYSRCATAYLDVPKAMPRKDVYNESEMIAGYAQMLSRYEPDNSAFDVNGSLYSTHSALFAPWGQYKYVGTSKYNAAPPSFLALLIQHSMISNQSLQYEWIMPSSRSHNIKVSKLAYKIPKKIMDVWQPNDDEGGVGVNVITNIPGLGTGLWGNQTLFENPPATYQALRNLSTRHLVCALEDTIYKSGIGITFRYNNGEAYAAFHAGVTPLLETMRNAGAIEDFKVQMAADLDALGMVKANSCVGKVWIVPVGVIETITVDLIALPPGTDLSGVE